MTTYTVTSSNDSGIGTLRSLIGLASPGDTIVFDASINIIQLSSQITINKYLTIIGNGSTNTIIERTGFATFSAFIIQTNNLVNAINISALTLRNFQTTNGAAMLILNSLVNINQINFVSNSSITGGAIHSDSSKININESLFNNNEARNSGGAIYQTSSTTSINNCTFESNRIILGDSSGGAISYVSNPSSLETASYIRNSTFYNNTAPMNATALIINATYLVILNSTFVDRVNFGGTNVIQIENNSQVLLVNDTLSYNSNSRLTEIIGVSNSVLQFGNSIICRNDRITTVAIWNFGATITSFGNNIVNSVNGVTLDATDIVTLDPQLNILGNYGGPTQTMPPLNTSPAIDAGSVGLAQFVGLTTDQRGFTRYCVTDTDIFVDIGSVEVGTCQICYTADTMILTRNIESGIIAELPVNEIYTGVHEVFSIENNKWYPVLCNIITEPSTEFILFKKDSIDINKPNKDLYITYGHPIKYGNEYIEAQKIPCGVPITTKKQMIYSIAIEKRIGICIQGLEIMTWQYADWIKNANEKTIKWKDNKPNKKVEIIID